MSNIKPWRERLDAGASSSDVMDDMQTEVTRLSTALAERDVEIEKLNVAHLHRSHMKAVDDAAFLETVMQLEMLRAAAQQALEALKVLLDEHTPAYQAQTKGVAAITALTAALESKT